MYGGHTCFYIILTPFYFYNMIKLKYKDFIGIVKSKWITNEDNNLKGKLIKVCFVKDTNIFNKLLRYIGIYIQQHEIYFWCPYKSILSIKNYGVIGKKSRGKYSNLWYELNNTNTESLKYLMRLKAFYYNFYNWIRDHKFQKVTNKKLKEFLDVYLPNLTQQNQI